MYGEDPETGRDLSFTGELGGFFGFRNQKFDFPESLGYKISEYNGALRDSRKFLPRPRGNVQSKDIIEGLIQGNQSWFEAQKEMNEEQLVPIDTSGESVDVELDESKVKPK